MKTNKTTPHRQALTIVELTVVIMVMTILVSATTFTVTAYQNWQKGLAAGETLKAVYQAQRLYLADNPTTPVNQITAANITPYLPNGMAAIPTITGLDDKAYTITLTVSPPVINGYTDPSGSPTDGQWDAGK